MIKINDNNEIASFHHDAIIEELKDCLQFYVNCLEINEHKLSYEDYDKDIKQLNANIKITLFNTISIKEVKKKEEMIQKLKDIKLKNKLDKRIVNLFRDMLNEKSKISTENILLGKPQELYEIYEYIKSKYSFLFSSDNLIRQNYIGILNKIFNYDKFSDKNIGFKNNGHKWGAYELLKKLNINVCPYCNRQYTFTVQENGEDIIRPDIEHFLPRHIYPMFALSFYNLIPSCKQCNTILKGDKDFKIDNVIHPYMDNKNNNNIKRTIFHVNFDEISLDDIKNYPENIKIFFDENYKLACVSEVNKEFIKKIEIIYNHHSNIVVEILDKLHTYTDEMLDDICKTLDDTKITKDMLSKIIFDEPLSSDEIINTPLGKLKKDIISEYKRWI